MSGVLIIGAGGHAKVIVDILQIQGVPILGYLDDETSLYGQQRLGVPILGPVDAYQEFDPSALIMGIGSNLTRRIVAERLDKATRQLWINAIHPQAVIASSVQLGIGIVVVASAVINPDTIIGDHAIINTGATVGHDCVIGSYTHIGPGTHLAGGVRVGEETFLGIGTVVIPGCHIGAKTVVGAGSVVVSDIPAGVTAKGLPASW